MDVVGPVFRVFLSSTFNDFRLEREALRPIWADIRRYCRDHGARFQIIDLRWGISEEASQDQRTIPICLEEIRRCQQVSPDFSFIALLGDRHGSRLLPVTISVPDFQHMLDLLNPDERDLLHTWYRLDSNALPTGEYVLLPRGGPKAVAGGAYASFDSWQEVQQKLLETLTHACQHADVSPATRLSILASVTEREVQAGIFDAPDGGAGALCFRRIIQWSAGETIAREVYFEISPQGQERLEAMHARLAALAGGILPFTAQYRGHGLTNDHLPTFVALVKAHVMARINAVLVQNQDAEATSAFASHQRFADDRLRHFTGRGPELAKVAAYLRNPAETSLLVTGPAGIGKTAFMLRALADTVAKEAGSLQTVVLHRFIGGSAAASDLAALLRDLVTTLAEQYGTTAQTIPAIREDLIRQWPSFLALVTAERPLILFLDGIDQLRDARDDLSWLPTTVPPFVHLVISVLDGPAVAAWQEAFGSVSVVHLDRFDATAIAATVTGLLNDADRRVQPEQEQYLFQQCAVTGLPLYVRLAVDAVQRWQSWQVVDSLPELADDVPGLLHQRFEQLETPAAHGQVLVQHVLGLIGAANDGVAEDELLDILSQDEATMTDIQRRSPNAPSVSDLPIVLWSRLSADLEVLLTEREQDGASLITFYHRQVGEVVHTRYLLESQGIARHTDLAQYFEAQSVASGSGILNLRKLGEQPIQEAKAHHHDALHEVLTDVSFLEAQLRRAGIAGVVNDLALAPQDSLLRQIASAVNAGYLLLEKHPEEIRNQILGRAGIVKGLHATLAHQTPRFELLFPTLLPSDEALVRIFDSTYDVKGCAFSPDGRQVLSASSDRTLRLWDVASGATLRDFEGYDHNRGVNGCVFSPDGSQVLSASSQELRLWDVASGALVRVFEGHAGEVNACAFSPDGRQALSASDDQTLRLWDVASGATLRVFEGHIRGVVGCVFSPDGSQVLSATYPEMRLWDVASGALVRVFEGHTAVVHGCAFSPGGRQALSASFDQTLRLWDVASGATLRVFEGHTSYVNACAFSPDGRQALSASSDRTLRLWDVASGATLRVFEGHSSAVTGCTFSPDGHQALSAAGGRVSNSDNSIRLWNVTSRVPSRVFEGHTSYVHGCAFSPDGRQALSASDDQTLRLWDVAGGATLRIFEGHTSYVHGCTFSPDGSQVLSASDDQTLRLWDVSSGATLRVFEGHSNGVNGCVFSPDGSQVLSASDDQTLRLWDVVSGATLRVFEGHTGKVNACAFSPDGRQVLSASSDRTMLLWNVKKGKILRVFEGHTGEVNACAFSPDGRQALGASYEELRLWNVASGVMVRVIKGHAYGVFGCAFSPDGRQALSASSDSTLRLWDVASGRELCRWTTEERSSDVRLMCCAFSPDGVTVIAGDMLRGVHFLSIVGKNEESHQTPMALTNRDRSLSLFQRDAARSAELPHESPSTDTEEAATMTISDHLREAVQRMAIVILWMSLLAAGLALIYSSVTASVVSFLYGGDAASVIHSYLDSRVPIIIDISFLLTFPLWVVQVYGFMSPGLDHSERARVRWVAGIVGSLPFLAFMGSLVAVRVLKLVTPASTLEEHIFFSNHLTLSLVLIVTIACLIKIFRWTLPRRIKGRATVIAILLGGMWILVAYLIPIWVWGVLFFAAIILITCLLALLWFVASKRSIR